ncbi:MAG: hypothetical protein A2X13_02320 [Bacteroidetes bacterium GWC2_33_15]|nr:MAG: hypothetical protein A2X10_07305 [Bacteroidetes bacterium GWA2_33_15]OFX52309.1 MAG: hypothetical protein A2X13_02320 [Bacteroidetes bacterium GWC2_33_15]OFX64463.1 MAG: hypothetical protein A2X15_13140 [Bacteroidetes bacterium GWB2_32_14]OFX67868.1 MAG: hypothetical protein A2X14_06965 [Bacteroidetes bacterium GWD2_33_33]HAN19487.1 hypothetical protein [Bacteroidales bacterium]
MNTKIILSTAYLAPVQYYSKLISYDEIWVEAHENFIKQTYRNRCTIYGANGALSLSVPIKKTAAKIKINEVYIDYATNWQKLHWKSIESAYRSSPFFEFYADELFPFYKRKYDLLIDYNHELQNTILSILNVDVLFKETTDFNLNYNREYDDFRYSIHPKKDLGDSNFHPIEYIQVFKPKYGFIQNLSIIDLIFNSGNDALSVLRKSFQI